MRTIRVKAVFIVDEVGNYFLTGISDASNVAMFKAMTQLQSPHNWDFDPEKENAHFLEFEVAVPEPDEAAYVQNIADIS